jgi:hypothetical protein
MNMVALEIWSLRYIHGHLKSLAFHLIFIKHYSDSSFSLYEIRIFVFSSL